MPVQRYAEERVAPFASSSTPQDRLVRMYTYQLLRRGRGPVSLGMRDAAGREREETVARSGYDDVNPRRGSPSACCPASVAYFALDHSKAMLA